MNTRAKRRTAASRQPVLYAGVRPPDCRRRSRYAPLPRRSIARNNAAISGSVGVGTGIIAAVLADGPCRSPTPARLFPRARSSNVYSHPCPNRRPPYRSWTSPSSLSTRRRRSRRRYTGCYIRPFHCIPDEPAGVGPGGMGGEARRGGGRRTVLVIRQGARRAYNSALVPIRGVRGVLDVVGHAKSPDAMMDPGVIRVERP